MTKQRQKPIEVGLVLQGGGALGAYEWGAVTALLELMDEAETAGREVALKGVTGVSIGAINAACIVGSHGRADARRRLKELWEDLRLDAPSFRSRSDARTFALRWSCYGGTRRFRWSALAHKWGRESFKQDNSKEPSMAVLFK